MTLLFCFRDIIAGLQSAAWYSLPETAGGEFQVVKL